MVVKNSHANTPLHLAPQELTARWWENCGKIGRHVALTGGLALSIALGNSSIASAQDDSSNSAPVRQAAPPAAVPPATVQLAKRPVVGQDESQPAKSNTEKSLAKDKSPVDNSQSVGEPQSKPAGGIYLSLGDSKSSPEAKPTPQAEVKEADPARSAIRVAAPSAKLPAGVATEVADQPKARKAFVDPSQFRASAAGEIVESVGQPPTAEIAQPEPMKQALATSQRIPVAIPPAALERLPEVNANQGQSARIAHSIVQPSPERQFVLPMPTQDNSSATPREQLDSVVQLVTSPAYTYRLPPVDQIPATSGENQQFVVQASARLSDASVIRSAPTRVLQDDETDRGAVLDSDGLPVITSMSELNPLKRLAMYQDDSGHIVPPNQFATYRDKTFDGQVLGQNSIRASYRDGIAYPWQPGYGIWEAPAFAHRPLYFEEVNLERYGHYVPRLQPALSGAHFVTNLATLPYQLWMYPPCEPIYTLGHHRPGSCNPHQIHYLPAFR